MYGRVISFTLLAPSLWSILDVAAKINPLFSRQIFKSGDNVGVRNKIFLPAQAGKISNFKSLKGSKNRAWPKFK